MKRTIQEDDAPPFLGTWKAVYVLIAGALLIVGVLFYIFTKYYE